MKDIVAWSIIVVVGIANLYLGRAFAVWGLPRMMVTKPSFKLVALSGTVACLGALFFLWNQQTKQFAYTFTHATILAGCAAGSYVFFRSFYGSGQPKVPWPDYLNAKIAPIMEICDRHKWDLSTRDAVMHLASTGQLEFDEGDYDRLVQARTDEEFDLRRFERLPETIDGRPDFDRECAKEIVSLCNSLTGLPGVEGIVSTVAKDYDLTGFDRQAFERIQWLAAALEQQWGLPRLYGSRN